MNDVFTYRVTDADGDAVTATLTIAISGVNDAPVADDETNTVTEDVTLTVAAASGLLAGDTDADGDSLTVTTFTVAGDLTVYNAGDTATIPGKGELTIQSDGSYVFDPAPNYAGSVPVATYTVSDGTTTDTGTLTLTVDAVPDAPSITGLNDNGGGTDGSVEESDFASGSTPAGTGEVSSGSFTVSAPDGITSLSVGGTTITLAQLTASGTTPVSIATTHGTLVIDGYNGTTGAVSYTFTLTAAADHSGGAVNETIALVLTDSDGDTAPATLAFVIVDDAPIAGNDSQLLDGRHRRRGDRQRRDLERHRRRRYDRDPGLRRRRRNRHAAQRQRRLGDQRQLRHADAQRQRFVQLHRQHSQPVGQRPAGRRPGVERRLHLSRHRCRRRRRHRDADHRDLGRQRRARRGRRDQHGDGRCARSPLRRPRACLPATPMPTATA